MHGEAHKSKRFYLSPPHMGGFEQQFIEEAFSTNWIAPLGPNVDAFEQEMAEYIGAEHTVALSSGTAALHLALILCGVGPGDVVLGSTLTFIASVNPILYCGATPAFVDSETESWNMDPELLAEELERRDRSGTLPKAVVVVHVYGQSANMGPILESCARYEIPVIEDAAEALGATYGDKKVGTLGRFGVYSFNGNKIITTSGGGVLVCQSEEDAERAKKLAVQAREPAPHYEHREVGYNYRLSNVLAGIGRGQLRVLEDWIATTRRNFAHYKARLSARAGIEFMPEATWGRHTRWLTTLTVDSEAFGADREQIRLALEEENIEARPIWKPMHVQPVFKDCECVGGAVSEDLFARGLCLPSGSSMTEHDLARVVSVVRAMCPGAAP
ncbi:aminotransferase class I/II-fold pyridoxal phosphate-dependent enzyme [Gemmatimonadota bacterium]